MSRKKLRQQIRAARRAVAPTERAASSQLICDRIADLEEFNSAQTVAGFLAFDGEADPLALMKLASTQGQQVYVPTIIAKGQPLMFVPWSAGCEMKKNGFGILEPNVPKTQWVAGEQLELVITPLVAFDESCHRIGVGGGFYDRTFEFLNQTDRDSETTHMVGFAFELQRLETIDAKAWDVHLNGVATEMHYYGSN